jgi:hypothetical protein
MPGKKNNSARKEAAKKILTDRQEKTLKRHAKHHTDEHNAEMRKAMEKGETFTDAHNAVKAKMAKEKKS